MIHIAVVEDEEQQRSMLQGFLEQYSGDQDLPVHVQAFQAGDELLEDYEPGKYDILLLDIQMPRLNGIETAEAVRKVDTKVLILFITNLVCYAVEGYNVRALDYIVKPVEYPVFARKLGAAVELLQRVNTGSVQLRTLEGIIRLQPAEIIYAEVVSRRVLIHTPEHTWQFSGPLAEIEEKLDRRFFRCHAAVLVNMEYIRAVGTNSLLAGRDTLPLSRHRRKDLIDAMTDYLGE